MSNTVPDATPIGAAAAPAARPDFVRGLGHPRLDDDRGRLDDRVGIFIVSADIARQTGSAGGLLLTWIITGLLTVAAALFYGELAAMMPKAGGQYVYLREAYSPLWGFLYGWTLFLVIQSGTIAAVAVAFARYLGVLVPGISPTAWIVPPIDLSSRYAISLSTQQVVAVAMIVLLTLLNSRGLALGKLVQNVFTSAKTLALLGLIVLGLTIGRNASAIAANFTAAWAPSGAGEIRPDVGFLPPVSVMRGGFSLLVVFAVAQVGSLFSADAWNNITFVAGEVKEPRRNLPMALAAGTGLVIGLYTLANVAYLSMLPLDAIQHVPDDRVGTAALQALFGGAGAALMAGAIVVSTFGCNNGLILAGARVSYAMAQDGLFFRAAGRLNAARVPARALLAQCVWACLLVLPRTRLRDAAGAPRFDPATGSSVYGNLYSDLLDYVVFSVLIFYVLTIAGLFVLRRRRPDAERPYRAFGYPIVPALYIMAALVILLALAAYKTQTTWPGLVVVLAGVPVYCMWAMRRRGSDPG